MASAVIGALRVNLGIDTAQFTESLKGVRASMANVGKQMQAWGGKLSTYISAPLTIAGGAVAAAAVSMAKDIDELRKAAQISNTGFEDFQRLAYAAKSVGIEGDKLADIFKDVNDRIGDFNQTGGGPMADFFEKIAPKVGITAEAFKNLSGPQSLQLYYDSLVKAGASQQEMTFYLEAMASDATALIPLLKAGGEGFRELGEGAAVISEGQAAGLKAYNDAMRALSEAVKGLTIALASSGIVEYITQMVQWLTSLVQTLSATNPEILKWGVIIGGIAAAIGPVVAALGLFLAAVSAISLPVLGVVAAIAALTAGLIAFWPEISRAYEATVQFAGGVWEQLKRGVENAGQAFTAFKNQVVQVAADIVNAFLALPGKMLEIGGQIIDGLWNGVKARWEAIRGNIASIGTGIAEGVKSALGIHSPSRVMHDVGVNVMQGLGNGMTSLQGKVVGTAAQTADGIRGAFDGIEGVGEGLGQGMESAFSGLGSSIADAISGTKEWRDVALDALRSVASSLISSMNIGGGGGGFFSGLFGSLFKGLVGFSTGGSILPGGTGGIDSQLVMFRKSPNERVDITKPGQSIGGGSLVFAPVINAPNSDAAGLARIERRMDEQARNFGKMVDARTKISNSRKTRG
ncbi:hypothetical protein [Rhizobium sp. LC145]|uniref:phage tail protein n=1 Tax=Rhizobium sp. LC145 TaxID=1120688 RepID=UPI00069BD7AB|nr:hypothetical protein [Rhizobium sp. LC145]TKT58356.1 hypothetical protein FDR95_12165 [Rhizobiaceae bacterium LC148]